MIERSAVRFPLNAHRAKGRRVRDFSTIYAATRSTQPSVQETVQEG